MTKVVSLPPRGWLESDSDNYRWPDRSRRKAEVKAIRCGRCGRKYGSVDCSRSDAEVQFAQMKFDAASLGWTQDFTLIESARWRCPNCLVKSGKVETQQPAPTAVAKQPSSPLRMRSTKRREGGKR